MKISIDPKLATQALKQFVPECEELMSVLESTPDLLHSLNEFAVKSGLSAYPQLYLDKQNILKLMLLTLMPAEEIKAMNSHLETLNQDEVNDYANQMVNNLNQSPEKLDAILDPHFPKNLNEIDPSKLSQQSQILMTAFFLWFYDALSFLVHGRRITDLVQSAINGDDEAFCLAVQTDHLVLTIPYFKDRLFRAIQLQTVEDERFLNNLGYRIQNSVLRGKIKNRKVWVALWLLDTMNLLDGSLTRPQLLLMFDEAGIDGVESEDNLSKMLRKFRAYQNT